MSSPIIIHAGSGVVQAGIAGDAAPRVEFKTLVDGKNPIENGIVTDWPAWTKLVQRAFTELGVSSQGSSVLFTEAPLNSKTNREMLTKIAFDTLKVSNMYVSVDATLALCGTQRSTGIVLMSDEGGSHSVPTVEGYALPHAIIRLNLGGRDLDAYMQKILAERGVSVDLDTARQLKEKLCYVPLDFGLEMKKPAAELNASATINGKTYTLGVERIRCPEVLFQPDFIGMASAGIHETTYNSIMKCDVDIRKDMYSNTILAGNTTMFPGLPERMKKEIEALAPPTMKIVITAPDNRSKLVFAGASILAALETFAQMCVTKAEYTASGPSIVHRKCL